MAIRYYTEGTDFLLPDKGRVGEWIGCAIREEGFRPGAINFVFCSPERHRDINRQFLGHDWPTDVITFDYTVRDRASGDIFIDPATVAANARALLIAPEVEMRRVMVHGCLHLCGWGDKTPAQVRQMRAKEDYYLSQYYGKRV
jgi:rRNA maturation RNase YbeY